MDTKFEFLAPEKSEYIAIFERTKEAIGDPFQENDGANIKSHLKTSLGNGLITRDAFGLNPVLNSVQTAGVAASEINLKRDGVVAILLYQSVVNGYLSIGDVSMRYDEVVAHITHGLIRINALYSKNPVVESGNFRNLLLTFAEGMHVILIIIADRVNLMRHIRDAENVEAKRQIGKKTGYLYAPLAHKLGLYQLKNELEDLSLKYLEHDAYYMIKDKLNMTKKARDSYIASFINPIQQKLEDASLKLRMRGRTKSIHSIWQKIRKRKCNFEGICDLFTIHIILDAPLEKEKMQC